jgi:putative ABC transport system permease protein
MFRRKSKRSDFTGEIEAHIRIEADRYRERGMSEEEALAAARRAFGNVTKTEERFYDSRRSLWWDNLRQDVRLAARLLAKTPGWTAVAVLTVALGIGATTAIFSIVNTVLLRPLPYPHPKQLYAVADAKFGGPVNGVGLAADYFVIRENIRGRSSSAIEEIGAYDSGGVNWTGTDRAERLVAGQVTASFFTALQAQPLYGRTFLPEEDKPGGGQVVVLSYSLWQRRFGGDASIVGKSIRIDRSATLVIGIMPARFDFPQGSDLWRPLALTEGQKMMRLVDMVARAKASASEAEVQNELAQLTQTVVNEYPLRGMSAKGIRFFGRPLQQTLTGDLRPALLVFSGAVGLMLLIVCFTVANLMLARATARGREIAVRVALGSPRRRIVSQLLTESLLVSLIGGAVGLGLAAFAAQALNATRKTALAGLPEVSIDISTAAFALLVTVLTGIAFGIAPSLGSLGFGVREALQGESRTASSSSGLRRMRQVLAIAQLGLSLMLLIGAGLLAKSFYGLRTRNPGYDAKNVLTARVNLAGQAYTSRQRQHEFNETLLDRVSRLPGVEAASIGAIPPGISGNFGIFAIEGRPELPLGQGPTSWKIDVSLDYFRVLGVPLKEGRAFARTDFKDAPLVVVVNEAFARRFFGGESALGYRVTSYTSDDWATIVGVVGDFHQAGLDQEVAPVAYRSFEQVADVSMTPRSNLLIRVSNDPAGLIPTLERVAAGMDRDQPVFDTKTLQQRLDDSLGSRRFDAALTGAFALIAMFLASIGVYGVMSYLVTLRTSEIGIRLALGAQRGQVVGLILREGVVLGSIGVALGVAGALGLSRYLSALLYGVGTRDVETFGVAALALFGAVLAACYVPGRRAARVDAAIALRHI